MADSQQPATGLSMTLRDVPADVVLAIKQSVLLYNAAHPGHRLTQTDVVVQAVRVWQEHGSRLPSTIK